MTWYETAFKADYLDVYAHRDAEVLRSEAAFAFKALGLRPGARVLDVACGDGSHARGLEEEGLSVTGLDLSRELLLRGEGARRVRGDMRALPFLALFEGVTSFFTSFGYFDDAGNRRVLASIARALLPGGRLFLDYLNSTHLAVSLEPEGEAIRGDHKLQFRRRLHDGRVEKDVTIDGPTGRRSYTESVRVYNHSELLMLLGEFGLAPIHLYGDFSGRDFTTDSPRCIVLAFKE